MLCYRCGSHVPDGSEACSNCGQRFDTGLRGKTGQYRRRPLDVEAGGIKPGDVLSGRYEIRGVLGSGPIGVVFRALDREIDVEVAIKVINPNLLQSADERAEFLRSLRQAKRLSHPNLVRVYDVGQVEATTDQPARAFFTAQLLDGMTLRRTIELRREKNQFFSVAEAEPVIAQIAQALDHAQAAGAHGDLKPENVMVLPDLLKVIDFGVTPAIPRPPFLAALRMRKADVYLAPEVLAGHAFDRRADVYSLGIIFGEMVSGLTPGASGQPPELREVNPELPGSAQALYRRALSPDAKVRFPTAGDLASELLTIAESAPKPRPPPLPGSSPTIPAPPPSFTPATPGALETQPARPKVPPPPPPGALDPLGLTPSPESHLIPKEALRTPSPDVPPPSKPSGKPLFKPLLKPPPPPDSPDSLERLELDHNTPRVDVILDPRDLKLKQRPRKTPPPPPTDEGGLFAPGPGRVAKPLQPIFASARGNPSTMDTAVRKRPGGSNWVIWVAVGAMALAAAAVVGGHFFYSWKSAEEERITDQLRNEQRELAQQQLDERLRDLDGGGADGGASGTGTPVAVASDTDDAGAPSGTGATGTTGGPVIAAVATTDGGATGSSSGGAEHPDAVETQEKHHREKHVGVAETQSADQEATGGCPSGMQLIGGGSFRFGTPASDDLGNFGDRPERKTTTHAYCIDAYEYPNQSGARPLTSVTATAAEAACKRDSKRLCSEEEWEKACKGPANHRFPYGDSFDPSSCRAKGGILASGSATACRSGYGVFDLSGNVAEWTSSRFQAGASDRAVKGGSTESPDYDLRCSGRANRSPSARSERLGFRCCTDVK